MSILKSIKKRLYYQFSKLIGLLPMQNIVVFNSFYGKGMADDPKYIALELLRREPHARLLWLLNDTKQSKLPEGIEPLEVGSLKAVYYLSRARVWIDNCRGLSHTAAKRKEQYYIQTWHATFGLKKLGTENDKSSLKRRNYVKSDMAMVDLMYSNNDFRANKYRTTFWYDGPVLKCDQPRVSFMMNQPAGLKDSICKKIGISSKSKIAMYAPTFRDDNRNDFSAYNYDFDPIVSSLEEKFGNDFVMLIRLHPNLRELSITNKFNFNARVVDVTSMPDMEELLCITDVLITDFSSSMFDFSIARKPVFLLAKDYTHYTTVNRELYFDPKNELPFSFSEDEKSLMNNIHNFNEHEYFEKCDDFFKMIGLEDHGKGDKVLADIVMSKMLFK